MTTEDDFQRALDANPEDWQTRLVLADWLEERGDPRADGYRALGRLRYCPNVIERNRVFWYTVLDSTGAGPESDLPDPWYRAIAKKWDHSGRDKKRFGTRREAEDAAALALAELPPKVRSGLLAAKAE